MKKEIRVTQACDVGTVSGVMVPAVTCDWIISVMVQTKSGRITHRHSEGFNCSRIDAQAHVAELMAEAHDYARAQYLDLLERDQAMLAEFQSMLNQANA